MLTVQQQQQAAVGGGSLPGLSLPTLRFARTSLCPNSRLQNCCEPERSPFCGVFNIS